MASLESVWEYTRPPRVEPCARRVRIVVDGRTIVDSQRALRVLETSHPPTIYVPLDDVAPGVLRPSRHRTFCEFKGYAAYYDVAGRREAAWYYADPSPGYEQLRGHVAFYPGRMDECFLDDELVHAQPGGFYGGWITSEIRQ